MFCLMRFATEELASRTSICLGLKTSWMVAKRSFKLTLLNHQGSKTKRTNTAQTHSCLSSKFTIINWTKRWLLRNRILRGNLILVKVCCSTSLFHQRRMSMSVTQLQELTQETNNHIYRRCPQVKLWMLYGARINPLCRFNRRSYPLNSPSSGKAPGKCRDQICPCWLIMIKWRGSNKVSTWLAVR